jgi:hypothetical protein
LVGNSDIHFTEGYHNKENEKGQKHPYNVNH